MEQGANPVLSIVGFWMFLQLALSVILILGGIYALYCLGRAALGMDRLATAFEEWVQLQKASSQSQADESVYVPQAVSSEAMEKAANLGERLEEKE